ncbi:MULTISPECIES: aminotransferase class V-fold PLP-dependent enzyme [unclassified Spirosoma]|uniref:aminotransferase class V-fold PLP-dependent enzyme n=1 Tax=unclassified Spirosoma TaxID=2621999 RepID=UPI000966DB6A|nr:MULTISPECIES: aminotransferase class V-fold PLP-dependent enzyme [unclassified Spirosoma]MBN8822964.1 aminotransferase class V-fold PLP-dependent enzyme [Spirosoma sp.]OJW73071.1 MAG: penicillin epimerase [Spirosoma sp. 48-14]
MPNLSKRQFLKSLAGATTVLAGEWAALGETLAGSAYVKPEILAMDDSFWTKIRAAYPVTKEFIQLENGYYSLAAQPVLDSYLKHIQQINSVSSYYMRTRQFDDKRASQTQLANLLGCSPDELIITRNTTESLDTVIAGLTWKAGDEVIMAQQDYGAMLDMFKLQARRHGIVNRMISVPAHPKSDDEIVSAYEKAITPKTRLLMVCHMVNITGHILPIQKITEMAHRHGVEVMVDGAHAFAQLNFKIGDLGGCDYYASSLHKWLGTPLGAGMLYVRKDKIKGIWPLFADSSFADDDIRKLNHTGTHPVATDLAIQDAIQFHQSIGIERKEARLRYLQRYWTDQIRHHPGIVLNTPDDPARSCAIANVGLEKIAPADLAKTLFNKYKIFTVAIDSPAASVRGIRVTPHVYTTTAELDAFVKALKELAA